MTSRISLLLLAALAAHAQPRTVLAGVYSEAQASRGEALYEQRCAKCHEGADVDGPPLKGAPFIDRWREDTLASLHAFIKTNMPQEAPGKLEDAGYRDLVAYLLKMNTYPAGSAELTAETMTSTLLVDKDGPKPLPANTLVAATGCLSNAGGAWMLTGAAALARTRNGDEITADEKKAAEVRALGQLSFPLRNFEDAKPIADAAALAGNRALVKGVLNRQATGDRINVLSYEVVAKGCQP
jgi:mono/diheme cytochrome c family protein